MIKPSFRSLIPVLLVLASLAGSPMAAGADQTEGAQQDAAQDEAMSEAEREHVLLRKAILLGFPAAAVGGLIIALIVTRKKRAERRRQAQQDRD